MRVALVTGYPLFLDLTGRRVVMVGGGRVAARRVARLVAAGADVHVIAPAVRSGLPGDGRTVHLRRYRRGDLAGAWLAHACTDDPAVNAAVAAEAADRRIWCVRADDASLSNARVPAVTSRDGVTVAISAAGDPRRAVAVRDALADRVREVVVTALAQAAVPLRAGRPGRMGQVALVGGGPGDPGLVTVRGRALLAQADVVVVDRLAPRELLATLPAGVEVVDAGKAAHRQNLTQQQINALLVDRARRGQRVVRLKGGDPFVFGRGGEEALACARAGVPVTVVPGVTSAVAVPAGAGIPVTHRGIAQDFAVVSGHLDPSTPGATVDWQALADGPATLVLLMALGTLDQVAAELVKRGRPAGTPAAVVCAGGTERQRVVVDDLGGIAAAASRAGLAPPAVVVVGEVVRLRRLLAPAADGETGCRTDRRRS